VTGARRTGHRRVYEGKVLSLDVDQVVEPGDVAATREVVRHHGSVATLAVDDQGRVALVRQYRYAVDEALWELPAGRRDGDETPEAGARRELAEETGLQAGHMELLADFFTTPGFCDERMSIFRASGLTQGQARPEGRAHRAALVRPRRDRRRAEGRHHPRRQDAGRAADGAGALKRPRRVAHPTASRPAGHVASASE